MQDYFDEILMIHSTHTLQNDNTQLAAPQQEAAQIQEETTNDTGCQSPYQVFN
jgi:hypothetical protein